VANSVKISGTFVGKKLRNSTAGWWVHNRFHEVGIRFRVEEEREGPSKTEVVAEPGPVRGGTGAALAPADGLLLMMAVVPTGRG
jgi:hypothetical protein